MRNSPDETYFRDKKQSCHLHSVLRAPKLLEAMTVIKLSIFYSQKPMISLFNLKPAIGLVESCKGKQDDLKIKLYMTARINLRQYQSVPCNFNEFKIPTCQSKYFQQLMQSVISMYIFWSCQLFSIIMMFESELDKTNPMACASSKGITKTFHEMFSRKHAI